MTPNPPLTEPETQLVEAYTRILSAPFEDKYEERWEDEPFDRAVDDFKAKAQEIGFADPFELLSRFKIDSYETIRAQLKKGPPACFRPGWRSPLLGKYIDPADVISRCKHVSGPEFTGGYRVVVFEFWASWCDPCVQVGPELSDMAEEFAGRMAFIGINNESIFGDTKEPDLGLLQRFLEENGDDFRHTTYVDNADGYAKENTDRRNISTAHFSKFAPPKGAARKARATFVMLVRESELYGAIDTVRQLEDRFNRHIQYPYVFLNDRPFSDRFKEVMKRSSKADMVFAQVPTEHWSYPSWISQDKAAKARTAMKNVIYGSSESYRHMCRYQSGLLVQHDALLPFDFYWRIEPNVKYSCDIEFDPFLYMQDNNKKYAFVISLYEYPETIHGLWNATREFMTKHPGLLAKDNAIEFISNDGGQTYNLCHFWSNFEIVDARWMRGEAFQQYFSHLDQVGGFYYERWGDAPVHTIAASLLLSVSEIHFFREIGYYHEPFHNCPAEPDLQAKCHCDPGLNVSTSHVRPSCDRERHTCTPKFLEMAKERSMVYPEELDDYQV